MNNKLGRALEILRTEGIAPLARRSAIFCQRLLWRQYLSRYGMSTSELQTFARERGRIWYDAPELEITYPHPASVGAPASFQDYTDTQRPSRRFLCELPSCRLRGPKGLVYPQEGALALETHGGKPGFFISELADEGWKSSLIKVLAKDLRARSSLSSPSPFPTNSPVFRLLPTYSHNYYHWIVEYLPQLRMLEFYEKETNKEAKILIAADPPSFVLETLSLMGYGPERLIEWNEADHRIANLLITLRRVHDTRHGFSHSIRDYSWLRDRVRSAVRDTSPASTTSKIYVSRQQANKGRRVRNYDEMIGVLEAHGFKPVVFEAMSFSEQILQVLKADVLVGPHGAGLVNMLFADDPSVIEFLPDTRLRPDIYLLAGSMGFEYDCLVSPADENDNMTVDVDSLQSLLARHGVQSVS